MKITKLDGRYTANRRWGFAYSVTFPGHAWKKYYALKSQAEKMHGSTIDIGRRYIWRDEATKLTSSPWAYKYTRSREDSFVYFRTEEVMDQTIMMYGLTREDN